MHRPLATVAYRARSPVATALSLVSAGMICLAALRASAADGRAPGFNWVRLPGAEACISSPDLARRVETRLGKMLFVRQDDAAVFVDGHVGRQGAHGWVVSVELSDPDGTVRGRREMRFQGDDCRVIDDAVALVIAVTLYPDTGLIDSRIPLASDVREKLDALFGDEPDTPEPPQQTSEPRAISRSPKSGTTRVLASEGRHPAAIPPEPTAQDTSRSWRFALQVHGLGRIGQLPNAAGGFNAAVFLEPPSFWPIALGAVRLLPQERSAMAGHARFDWMSASLALCPSQYEGRFELALCIGGEVGRVSVEPSFASLQNRPPSRNAMILLNAGETVRFGLTQGLLLHATAGLSVPLPQRTYSLVYGSVRREFFRPWPVLLQLELGMEWRFGK